MKNAIRDAGEDRAPQDVVEKLDFDGLDFETFADRHELTLVEIMGVAAYLAEPLNVEWPF